jgi:hypothetical protein
MYYVVMSEDKLEDKRTSTVARMIWKNIRNDYKLNDWFNFNDVRIRFQYYFTNRQINNALRQLKKRNLIRAEQKGVRVINEGYLIDLIKRVPQKNYIRLVNVIDHYFIENSFSEGNDLSKILLIKEQYTNLEPVELFHQLMMAIIDNYRMEKLDE